MGTGRRHGWLLAGTLAVLAVGAGPAPAFGAATLSGSAGSISYSDAADINHLTVTQSGANLVFADTGAAITSSGTCAGGACPDSSLPALTISVGTGLDSVAIDSSVSGHLSSITVQGGTGDDQLFNNSAVRATLDYSASNGPMTVDLACGCSTGPGAGDGADTFFGFEDLNGSSVGDALAGDSNANVINGGGGADTIAGAGGDDTLNGGTGQDTVTYSPIAGTSYAGASTGVDVNLAAGTATGDGTDALTSFETAIGSAFDDTMIPSGGGSTLHGSFGNDTLVSGPSDDTFDGGGGSDTLDYGAVGSPVVVNLATGLANGDGTDTITTGTVERVLGSSLNDTLTGDQFANTLDGQGGNDLLAGGGGDDTLIGGGGRNTADFGSSLASVTANLALGTATGQGTDTFEQIQNLNGSALGDSLTGDGAANVIQGAGGDDTIAGRAGDDTLSGGAGTGDTVTFAGSSSGVYADLGAGIATGEGADTLSGFEAVTGSNFADTILARDSLVETLRCGPGVDAAIVDVADSTNADCESIDNGTPPPPPPPTPTTTVTVTAPAPPAATTVTVTAPAPLAATTTVTAPAPPPVTTLAPQLPVAKITGHPASTVKTKKATARVTFTFSSSAQGATFTCSRDFGAFARCPSPSSYAAKVGKHTFTVEAVAAGVTGSPVTARFTVKKSR
jgi:Ca2+-binding RTX toxin-like protein